jgi:DNA repair exonuclease SbcCD ATPase subunit
MDKELNKDFDSQSRTFAAINLKRPPMSTLPSDGQAQKRRRQGVRASRQVEQNIDPAKPLPRQTRAPDDDAPIDLPSVRDSKRRFSHADLESQIRDLEIRNLQLQRQNRDIKGELSVLKIERSRAAQIATSLAAAERRVAELSQILHSKEATITKLKADHDIRQRDRGRLLEIRSGNLEKSAAKQKELLRLQQELEQCKQTSRVPEEPKTRYRSDNEPDLIRRPTVAVPPAMRDNLVFGDDPPANRPCRTCCLAR